MDRAEAARRLGMKPREIVDVTQTPDGHVVTNHVGNHTLIATSGELVFGVPAPPEPPAELDTRGLGEVVEGLRPDVRGLGDPASPATLLERAMADITNGRPPLGLEVPAGSIAVVMSWVVSEPATVPDLTTARAVAALAAEQTAEAPRKTLVEQLQRLAGLDDEPSGGETT